MMQKQHTHLFALILLMCSHTFNYAQELPGVQTHQKISDTDGSFTGTLDNSDLFGKVSYLGDLNGDGHEDIAVGASSDDDGGSGRGAVWILFLDSNGTVDSHQKISDTQGSFTGALSNSDQFGITVAAIGDLDGDGITDLAVGAQFDDDGGTNRGAVWILFMNTNGTVDSHQKISDTDGNFTGALSNDDRFGGYVTRIGDLNDDGNPDIAVGARNDDDGGTNRGAVWILMLAKTGDVLSHQKISDTQGSFTATLDDSDQLGVSCAGPGDIDGDGIEDLIIGAWQDDDGGTDRGAIYAVTLDTSGVVQSYTKVSAPLTNDNYLLANSDGFGISATTAADIDNDGINEVFVGALYDDEKATNAGALYMLSFNRNTTLKNIRKVTADQAWDFSDLDSDDLFGISIAPVGDLNDDGSIDYVVGANKDDDGGTDRGAAYILFMDTTQAEGYIGTVDDYQKIGDISGSFTGTLDNSDNFGASVANIGDLDGDGIDDMVVGATGDDDGGSKRGAVYILFMNADGTIDSHQKISDTQGSFTGTLADIDIFGNAVSGLGDLDGDGNVDIAVGAKLDNAGGAIWILFLDSDGTVLDHEKITVSNTDYFGSSIANIGDLDDDGVIDLAVGDERNDDGSTDNGAVHILFLRDTGSVKSSQKISDVAGGFTGTFAGDDIHFGASVAGIGDLDADGIEDIAVGATGQDTTGAVWILFLDTDGTVDSYQKINNSTGGFTGTLANDNEFGSALASISDLNNDTINDLSVGQPYSDEGGNNRGAIWHLMLDTDGTIKSQQKISSNDGQFYAVLKDGDRFGCSLAYMNDLNENGFPDLAVGASFDHEGGSDRGAVYVLKAFAKKNTLTPYAKLSKRLDAGYYTAAFGKLHFQYDEEYKNYGVQYNIYDESHSVVVDQTDQVITSAFKDNRFLLDLTINGNCLANGYYILEVISQKNEKSYLRFKQQGVTCPTLSN
jgi:hypothetical protein